jgi:hypothetical protein
MDLTLNDSAGSSPAEAPYQSPGGELISTVEYRDRAPAEDGQAKSDTSADDKQEDKGLPSGDQKDGKEAFDRFDQHPRFKEVIREKNELKKAVADLTAKMEALSTRDDKGGSKEKADSMADLDDSAIFEKLNNNPKQFLADLAAKIKADTLLELSKVTEQEASKNKVVSAYEAYAKSNPDFDEMWDSGKIQEFIAEHPEHNAISAHMALTADKRIQEATERAVAEATAKTQKQFQAKRGASVLSGGPASSVVTGGKASAELADTKKVGGITAAIAARLERMRAAG